MGTGHGWTNAQCRYRRKEWRKTLLPELESWDQLHQLTMDRVTNSQYHSNAFTPDHQDQARIIKSKNLLKEITNTFPSRRLKTWNKFQDHGLWHFDYGQPGEASSLRALAGKLDISEQTCRDLVNDVREWYAPVHEGNIVRHTAELAALAE